MIGKTSAGTSAKEEKTVTAGTAQKVVTPSNGKLLSKVTINPTPSQAKTATPTAAQQTIKPDSGKMLSQVLVNAVPDSEKKGLYAWKKCSVQKELAETTKSNVYISTGASGGASYTYIYADSYSVDLDTGIFTLNNPQTYAGQVMYPPSVLNGKYIMAVDASIGSTYTPKTSGKELWFIPSDATLTGGTGYGSADTVTSYKVDTLKSVLDFAVSDDPTAYPDGGEQDGYWYEKVVEGVDLIQSFGYTKYAIDKFTLSSEIAVKYNTCYINHSLGEKPSFAFLISVGVNTDYRVTGGLTKILTGSTNGQAKRGFYLDSGYEREESLYGLSILDATRVSYNSGNTTYMAKGVEYTLITMA